MKEKIKDIIDTFKSADSIELFVVRVFLLNVFFWVAGMLFASIGNTTFKAIVG